MNCVAPTNTVAPFESLTEIVVVPPAIADAVNAQPARPLTGPLSAATSGLVCVSEYGATPPEIWTVWVAAFAKSICCGCTAKSARGRNCGEAAWPLGCPTPHGPGAT